MDQWKNTMMFWTYHLVVSYSLQTGVDGPWLV